MKPPLHTPANRASQALAFGLAALLTVSPAFGQSADSDALRRLQEENAALRKQLAEMAGKPAPAPASQPASQPASSGPVAAEPSVASAPSDPDTLVLSPFEVKSEKDYGYLKTNSATATRIGAEIQNVPLSISVLSSEFIQDTGMRDIQDVLRYVASSTGDPKMGLRQPGNSATPSGTMQLRGFPISQRLRNGVFRYTGYNLDNVDRVEIIKGPAAVFYGVGFPGGVINYVTKKPSFVKTPTTVSYGYGGEGGIVGDQRATIDHNAVLNDKAAFRVVGGWNNFKGDKNWEYSKGFSVTPSFTIKPFGNEKLVITAEVEHFEMKRNQDDSSWTFDEQYFKDYSNPSNSLLVAAGIDPASPTALATWQSRMNVIGSDNTWVGYKRIETNNRYYARYQKSARGAFYTDLNGNRVHDEKFNYYGRGAYTEQEVDTLEVTVDAQPFPWMDARYTFTGSDATFGSLTNAMYPYANGYEFRGAAPGKRGDNRATSNHQLDIVMQKEIWGIKHKLLTGGLYSISEQQFYGYGSPTALYINIPGAAIYNDAIVDNGTTNIPPWLNAYSWGLAFQTIKDRKGNPLNAFALFNQYDPASHVAPDISRVTMPDRSIVDAGKPETKEYYINYMADLLDDRLHLMAGYRWTYLNHNGGQRMNTNPPWYMGDGDLRDLLTPDQWNAYSIGSDAGFVPFIRDPLTGAYTARPLPTTTPTLGSFYQGSFVNDKGTSLMLGASYELTPEISLYASYSQSFRPTRASGAIYAIDGVSNRATLLGLNPTTELARIRAQGADQVLGNEEGINTEFGVKTSLWQGKLVTTFSLFRLDRANEALDDIAAQQAEPLNYTGPNKTGTYTGAGSFTDPITGLASTGVRWYGNGTLRRVEGSELEVIWTPKRNYQMVASASWLWQAETLLNTAINPTATDQATIDARYYNYEFRMPGVSEYRLNLFNKYTFTTGIAKGLNVAGGVRYASTMNIENSTNYDSKNGGLTAGDYVVFDGNISYPWEVGGFRVVTTLNVTNLTNEDYVEGGGGFGNANSGVGYSFSPPRTWMLTNTLSF